MKLEHLTLIRPNMGNYRSTDGMPPISMSILAARTPDGVEVAFYDDKVEEIPESLDTDLIAITVETFTAHRSYELADRYRAQGIPVVLGGYHPTFLPREALEHADAVVVGDAEGAWEALLADFSRGQLQEIYRSDHTAPLGDYRLDKSIFAGKKYAPIEPVQYGRGCRFACDFCSIRAFYGSNLRNRPLDSLRAELEALGRRRVVFFVDDNLFNSRPALEDLLTLLRPLKIRWACQISIDVARDDELLDRMRESGCLFALMGFESLSRVNLRQMGKRWNHVSGDYVDVVRRFHERGIGVYGTFVFGYDDDTVQSFDDALEFALEARLEIANFNPLTPTPGTPLYDRLEKEGRLLLRNWWTDPGYRYGDAIFRPMRMDAEEMARKCFETRKAFYSWRSIARRVLTTDAGISPLRSGAAALANYISRREILNKQYRELGA